MNLLKWVKIIFLGNGRDRLKVVDDVISSVKLYKKGEVSEDGKKYHNLVSSKHVELIGFTPNITYIRANSNDENDLDVLWDHRFSGPTLLFHLKDSPIMLLVNPNMTYNDSRLLEIEENSNLVEIKDLKGIIG
jgi:hypothetical protein